MATVVEFDTIAGLMLSAEFRLTGGDVLATSQLATEYANDKGCYTVSVTLATGTYKVRVRDGDGVTIARGILNHKSEATFERVGLRVADLGEAAVDEIADAVESNALTPAEVWSHPDRSLTQSAAQIAAIVAGSSLTLHRGDTLTINLTGLGDISGRDELWFSIKNSRGDADADAQLIVEENGGIVVLAGGEPAAGETASIVVTDEEAGNLTITISAAAAKRLTATTTGVWDVQMATTAGVVTTLTEGAVKIVADVTRRIEE